MVVIEDCGHVIQEDYPSSVAKSFRNLTEFLKIPLNYTEEIYVMGPGGKKIVINRWLKINFLILYYYCTE